MTERTISKLVSGNEAIAWGALVSGVEYFSHYPGSPVNLVEPSLLDLTVAFGAQVIINDALNEHVAALSAAGASLSGARSMVVMKHVGMNIAADPFNYVGYTGVKGGMVIVIGTDPGATCSTGEEDVHWYLPQINFPLLEPTSVPEIFTDVCDAFTLSERYELPVVLFVPTRLCYASSMISIPEKIAAPAQAHRFEKDRDAYINVGQNAVP